MTDIVALGFNPRFSFRFQRKNNKNGYPIRVAIHINKHSHIVRVTTPVIFFDYSTIIIFLLTFFPFCSNKR
jgi:hypothetical protein